MDSNPQFLKHSFVQLFFGHLRKFLVKNKSNIQDENLQKINKKIQKKINKKLKKDLKNPKKSKKKYTKKAKFICK